MDEKRLLSILQEEFSQAQTPLKNLLALFSEGATVPFIARYRKEMTGGMDEVVIRAIADRKEYLDELAHRKATVLKSIEEQGKLDDELKQKIELTLSKSELEDLYLPYKPKRRTRATIAKENGLEPLANLIEEHNTEESNPPALEELAEAYIQGEQVPDVESALAGASDILAERVAEHAEYRAFIRDFIFNQGVFKAKINSEVEESQSKYSTYKEYECLAKEIPAHAMLALRRGETEGELYVELAFDEGQILHYLYDAEIFVSDESWVNFYQKMISDAFKRLMHLSIVAEVRLHCKQLADEASVDTFEKNLRELLLSAPAGMKPTLGIDPGFRTGCKVAALDPTGKFVAFETIYPHNGQAKAMSAADVLLQMIQEHQIELIAVGNGTAGRETLDFLKKEVLSLTQLKRKPTVVMVNESGASIYSASEVARQEFPDLDLTVRGAVSIGRRLQDPLAELVKIDPKSIGVGQYQHDIDQKLLKKRLQETVESCVNFVGVDLNTASKELLAYVSGISLKAAENIIQWRNEHGAFKSRQQLLDVKQFGPKAFEQAAGFLRIRDGLEALDNTAVHPERYTFLKSTAKKAGLEGSETAKLAELIASDMKAYINNEIGLPTLEDILEELRKPGRDPRAAFTYANFKEGVNELKDLQEGMVLEGVVTNVANFGAFVDIGVHQDGLVHISQLADRFVKDPNDVVKVGQVVRVRVTEIDIKRSRIALSMRSSSSDSPSSRPNKERRQAPSSKKAQVKPTSSIEDLKSRFNQRI